MPVVFSEPLKPGERLLITHYRDRRASGATGVGPGTARHHGPVKVLLRNPGARSSVAGRCASTSCSNDSASTASRVS